MIEESEKPNLWQRLGIVERRGSHYYELCKCACGTVKYVEKGGIGTKSKSCGCDSHRKRLLTVKTVGGASSDPKLCRTYRSWLHARNRCTNPNSQAWALYGGRGITMCKEWADSFDAFLRDMGPAQEGDTIERIDVNGNYEPSNCMWIKKKEQAKNRRTNRFIEFDGERLIMSDWAAKLGISRSALSSRLRRKSFEAVVKECRR